MPRKSQSGFTPVLIVILLAIITGSFVLVIKKNIPFNQPEPGSEVQKQASDSAQINTIPSPTPAKTSTVFSSKKPTPTSTPTKTPINTTSSDNTPTPTNTPVPTNTPNPTPTPIPTPTPLPSSLYVKVTYPNGGEAFTVGDSILVTWDTNMPMGDCAIQTIDSNNSGSDITGGVNVTNRSIGWTADMGNTPLTEKQYKIYMVCHDFNGGTQFARSSNYFTVHK